MAKLLIVLCLLASAPAHACVFWCKPAPGWAVDRIYRVDRADDTNTHGWLKMLGEREFDDIESCQESANKWTVSLGSPFYFESFGECRFVP
jgi:hypothetical protein